MARELRIFIGRDPRQPIGPQVLAHSIYTRASEPPSITQLVLSQLPIKRQGLTQFTYSRYLVPWLCNYEGRALFLDADILCLCDVKELFDIAPKDAVCVVKNKHRFEWPSVMFFNNEKCTRLTPEFIDDETTKPMSFGWADTVGDLPAEFNHLVGYDEPKEAKIVHYTAGLPCWAETWNCPYSEEWRAEFKACNSTVSWQDLMGQSVHADLVRQSGWTR